ncbi:hypothetical protein B7463_g4490, partial [Scytalidium lignicola]
MSRHCAWLDLYFHYSIILTILLLSRSFAQNIETIPSTPSTSTPAPTSTDQLTNPSITLATVAPTPSSSSTTTSNTTTHLFNYYFLILAVLALALALLFLYYGRRRRKRAAIIRADGRYALARDVDGWRGTRGINSNWANWGYMPSAGAQGYRSGRARPWNNFFGSGDREGLDERGEAPPPYAHEDKPPSIDVGERSGRVANGADAVELRQMDPAAQRLPRYDESVGAENETTMTTTGVMSSAEDRDGTIRRPDTAVTAPRRSG